jgi:hypothetical protein
MTRCCCRIFGGWQGNAELRGCRAQNPSSLASPRSQVCSFGFWAFQSGLMRLIPIIPNARLDQQRHG